MTITSCSFLLFVFSGFIFLFVAIPLIAKSRHRARLFSVAVVILSGVAVLYHFKVVPEVTIVECGNSEKQQVSEKIVDASDTSVFPWMIQQCSGS